MHVNVMGSHLGTMDGAINDHVKHDYNEADDGWCSHGNI